MAQSTFGSQNVQNTTCWDHFSKIRWRIDVQKVHTVVARRAFGSENAQSTCTPLRREARVEVQMYKTPHMFRPLFEDSMAIRCPKSARRRDAKDIWKSNVPKTEEEEEEDEEEEEEQQQQQ